MENFTDIQLVEIYLNGNNKAFEGIINRYGQMIYRFAVHLTGNKEEAHDIAQDTFIKAWKNIRKFDTSKNLKTWLFIIARRTAIDYLRKRKSVSFSSMDNEDDGQDFDQSIPDDALLANEIFEQNENIDLIQKALENVSIENRTIVLLHNGEEMTFEEIAEIIEKPMNTIKSQYRRTLISLKKIIEKQVAPKA